MKVFMFVFIIVTALSCSKSNFNKQVDVQTLNYIVLKNNLNENLLDPKVPNYYLHDSILVFTVDSKGNELVLQKDLVKSSTEIPYFIRIVEYGISDMNAVESTVFLRLSETDVDTIKVEYKIESGNLYNTKLWYNGELKWTKGNDNPIVIIKE